MVTETKAPTPHLDLRVVTEGGAFLGRGLRQAQRSDNFDGANSAGLVWGKHYWVHRWGGAMYLVVLGKLA